MYRTVWQVEPKVEDLNSTLARYKRYLVDQGLREVTVEGYTECLKRYLKYAQEQHPPVNKASEYREHLLDRKLSKQSVNNSCIAIKRFYLMHGEKFEFKFLKVNNILPIYFDEEDVLKIFTAASINLKHLTMLKMSFYCCLRASELCKLEDKDVDLKNLTIRIRNGKGGKDGIVYLSEDCARTLRRYLEIRPKIEIDGKTPLFYTDHLNLWNRREVYRMFMWHKKRAGIVKPGGFHIYSRHTPACLLVKNGMNLLILKEILRHNDIKTTMRYAFVSDDTKRSAYDKAMIL